MPSEWSRYPRIKVNGQWDGKDVEYLAGRVVVKLKGIDNDSSERMNRIFNEIAKDIPDGRLLRHISTGHAVFLTDVDEDIEQLAREISRRDDVEYAFPDFIQTGHSVTPSDTQYVYQWGFGHIGAPDGWDLETGDAHGILIGVIDSGISMSFDVSGAAYLDHPDLNDPNRYLLGRDYVIGDDTPRDEHGHGTHIAGIAGAQTDNSIGVAGMNWNTPVYVCRVFNDQLEGTSADVLFAVKEIVDFAVDNLLLAVINYSGGGPIPNPMLEDACQYVSDHGMILCASVGGIPVPGTDGVAVEYPAAYSTSFDCVVAVSGVLKDDTVPSWCNNGPEVTVVAPCWDILSTLPPYNVTLNDPPINAPNMYAAGPGTSQASAFVSGLISLMWSRHPSFDNTKIVECIKSTAVKLGPGSVPDNSWGFGRVDSEQALRCGDTAIDERWWKWLCWWLRRFKWFRRFKKARRD